MYNSQNENMLGTGDGFYSSYEATVVSIQKILGYMKRKNQLRTTELGEYLKLRTELLRLNIPSLSFLEEKSIEEGAKYVWEHINNSKSARSLMESDVESDIEESVDALKNSEVDEASLESEVDEITSNIENDRNETMRSHSTSVETLLDDTVDRIDEERAALRRAAFDKNIRVSISRSGKNLYMKWNISMTELVVKIPSAWDVQMDHSLLLDLHTTEFGKPSASMPRLLSEEETELVSESVHVSDEDIQDNSQAVVPTKNRHLTGKQAVQYVQQVDAIDEDIARDIIKDDEDSGDDFTTDIDNELYNKMISDISYTKTDIIDLFKKYTNFTSVRNAVKRRLVKAGYDKPTYKNASVIITILLAGITSEELSSLGLDQASRIFKKLSKSE